MEDEKYVISKKDSILDGRFKKFGHLVGCKHGNGRDWWFLQFSKDTAYVYMIGPGGVKLDHIQLLPFELREALGQAKFSDAGDQFALYGVKDFSDPEGNDFMYAGFDRCAGNLIDPIYSELQGTRTWGGLEFSPSGRFIYTNSFDDGVLQFDLNEEDFLVNPVLVAQIDGFTCDFVPNSNNELRFKQFKTGPDNRIYVSIAGQCNVMHRINHPDSLGLACDVEQRAIQMPTFFFGTVPTFNTYRLGPLDGSDCDTLGIDNHPVARFWFESDSIDHRTIQFYDVSYFRPESWSWTFGDGQSSTDRHPSHDYAQDGVYEVCLTVENENTTDENVPGNILSAGVSCQTLHIGTVSTQDPAFNPSVNIFPNPVEDYTRIVINGYLPESAVLNVYDIRGQRVATKKVQGNEDMIYLGDLMAGSYVYELVDMGEVIIVGKLVKI